MANAYSNEATTVDLRVIKQLENLGWVVGDSLLYQPEYQLTEEQQREFNMKSIKPDIVLQDSFNHEILAVFENKLADEKKGLFKLRTVYSTVLKPRFLYGCSENRTLMYDTQWRGLDAGEFRRTNSFLSYEEMKMKIEQLRKINSEKEIKIDTTIAGGYDATIGKDRYYQLDCINTVIDRYRSGKQKMLVHMATGLGKTRTSVALVKALLENGFAKKVLFVVDRRMLAKQALEDGFSLISRDYPSSRLRTSNFKQQKHTNINVVVIDTLESIYKDIPSNFYDLLIVDECHRSISVNRKLIFDHFLCPRLGLTATPKIAEAAEGANISEEDLAIKDTYKLFGCEDGEPDYKFDLDRGIEEGFLAPYDTTVIKTQLTKEAETDGVEFEYVLDPDERSKIDLGGAKKLKLEQLEKKYISEERCKRIAEEIRKNTNYGEKIILFGVSQAHCLMLTKALNEVFNEDGSDNVRYAEAVISDNQELNEFLKSKFKKPFEKPYITVSVDILSTGVDIPPVRYIAFAALTKSVGKYIQMVGRGSRLDPKSGKFSFKILDFVGLTERMGDNGKGKIKENKVIIKGKGGGNRGGGTGPKGPYFIIDNPDPENLITRVHVHSDKYNVVDNIPIEQARVIFEEGLKSAENKDLIEIKEKVSENPDYTPTEEELEIIEEWAKNPNIFLDEGTSYKKFIDIKKERYGILYYMRWV
nr:DEAD/DEAH box helicase family protein [Bacillus subtilis]